MTKKISTTFTAQLKTCAAIGAALVSTMVLAGCSGGSQAALPLAPSALPSSLLALEAADASADGDGAWSTLGNEASDTLGSKGKDGQKDGDKGKDKGGKDTDHDEDDEDDDASRTAPVASTTVKIEGVIVAASGACPARTFVVGTQSVVTDAATTFEGGLCAQIAPLATVEVRAVRRADGTLLAKGVEFEETDVDDDEDARRWEGIVSDRTGTCPAITFIVATRSVVTNATTVFHGGTCLQVLDGTRVRARGTLQPNGTVLASRVDLKTEDDDDTEDDDGEGNPHHGAGPHDGTVSSFRGVCPAVTFNLKGLTIVADGATTYVNGTCATLRPNVQVVVTGALAPERRTFKAATITITRTH